MRCGSQFDSVKHVARWCLIASLLTLLLCACGVAAPVGGSGIPTPPPAGVSPIKHVVFLIKENHSFDSMFARFPRADGTSTARVGNHTVPLGITNYPVTVDIGHS